MEHKSDVAPEQRDARIKRLLEAPHCAAVTRLNPRLPERNIWKTQTACAQPRCIHCRRHMLPLIRSWCCTPSCNAFHRRLAPRGTDRRLVRSLSAASSGPRASISSSRPHMHSSSAMQLEQRALRTKSKKKKKRNINTVHGQRVKYLITSKNK